MENRNINTNRKAFHDYFILEKIEAGIVLTGTEVKSLRDGRVNLKESHASLSKEELFLYNCHINQYDYGNINNHDPIRKRKLLLHRKEINKLIGKIKEKGLSIIPLRIYFNNRGIAKVELAVVKGKKMYDKRETLIKKAHDREIEREMSRRAKGS